MPHLVPLIGLVLVCSLVGVLQLLSRSSRTLSIPALLLGAWGAAGLLFFRSEPAYWLPALALAGIVLLLWVLRRDRFRAFLANPVLQGLFLFLAGPGVLLAVATFSKQVPDFKPAIKASDVVPYALTLPETELPVTDKGRRVPLYTAQDGGPDVRLEPEAIRHYAETVSVIRTGKADLTYNCHGWVFTGGKGLIGPEGVAMILHDNGYREVDQPHVDDLIVYYEGSEILHTGVVRAAHPHGFVLVESKWGWEGRFIHAPENQPCGQEFRYYHSSRAGHHLLNLPPESLIAQP
jgi:hypothetical protein